MVKILLSSSIVFPATVGAVSFFARNTGLRKAMIILSSFLIAVISILIAFYLKIPGLYYFYGSQYLPDLIIKLGDFFLIFYILWISYKISEPKIAVFTLLQLIMLVYFDFFVLKESEVPFFFADELSILMNLIISIVGSIIAIYSLGYMERHERLHHVSPTRQPRFFAIVLMFIGAMNGLIFSNSLMGLYFFWEFTSLCSFLLISHDGTKEAAQNGARALWMNMLGGVAFIAGIIFLYTHYGILSLDELLKFSGGNYITIFVALLGFAAFTKAAQPPFESWLLGAMVAPTPVSSLLHSSTMVKAGIYLLLRLAPIMKGSILSNIIAIYGAYTFLSTAVLALSQSNAKRILAYSTVSNLGLMIASIGINTSSSIAAAMMLLLFHAVSKGLLFLCVGTIEQEINSRDIEDMKGLILKMPVTSLITSIGILTLMIAPFGMLLSKWLAMEAASRHFAVAMMMAAGSAVSVIFYSRWIGNLISTTKMGVLGRIRKCKEKLPNSILFALESLAFMAVAMSLFVGKIFNAVIKPEINLMHMELSIRAASGYLSNGGIGGFSVYPVFIMIFLAGLLSLMTIKNSPALHTTSYMCGLQHNTMDYEAKNYYLGSLFNEDRFKRYIDFISAALILLLMGGSII